MALCGKPPKKGITKFNISSYLDVIRVDNERHEFLPVPGLAVVQDYQLGTGAHIDQGLLG